MIHAFHIGASNWHKWQGRHRPRSVHSVQTDRHVWGRTWIGSYHSGAPSYFAKPSRFSVLLRGRRDGTCQQSLIVSSVLLLMLGCDFGRITLERHSIPQRWIHHCRVVLSEPRLLKTKSRDYAWLLVSKQIIWQIFLRFSTFQHYNLWRNFHSLPALFVTPPPSPPHLWFHFGPVTFSAPALPLLQSMFFWHEVGCRAIRGTKSWLNLISWKQCASCWLIFDDIKYFECALHCAIHAILFFFCNMQMKNSSWQLPVWCYEEAWGDRGSKRLLACTHIAFSPNRAGTRSAPVETSSLHNRRCFVSRKVSVRLQQIGEQHREHDCCVTGLLGCWVICWPPLAVFTLRSVLALVYEQLYRAEVHHFQPRQSQGSVPCLWTVWSAPALGILGVIHDVADCYRLPSAP